MKTFLAHLRRMRMRMGISEKFFASIFIISLILITLLGFYYAALASGKVRATVLDGRNALIENNLNFLKENLHNHADWINLHFSRIEEDLHSLRIYTEHLFAQNHLYPTTKGIDFIKHASGCYYTPAHPGTSNLFISADTVITDKLLAEMALTDYLEPFFRSFDTHMDYITAVYFLHSQSALRNYPALDFSKLIQEGLFPADLNVSEYSFYNLTMPDANPEKKVMLTEIYRDITDRGFMVTWNAPVYLPDGTMRGMVGIDMTVGNILDSVLSIELNHQGAYAFLVTHTGQIVSPSKMLLKDLGLFQQVDQISVEQLPDSPLKSILLTLRGAEIQNTHNSEEKYILSALIPINNWTLYYVIPSSEITKPLDIAATQQINTIHREIIFRALLATLLSILIAGSAARMAAKKITSPIMELTDGLKEIAAGNFHKKIISKRTDEIGALVSYYNHMSEKIHQLIKDLKEKAEKEAELKERLSELNQGLEQKVQSRTKELHQANISLRNALNNLEQMQKSRRILFGNISHELKTPLTMLVGYIEALTDGIPGNEEEYRNCLNVIRRQSDRLTRIITDLIEFSKIEDRHSFQYQIIDTNEFFLQYFDELALFLDKRQLHFDYGIHPGLPALQCDPDRMIQVFNNLVQNAVRSTSLGGLIRIKVSSADDRILIEFTDNGCGMRESELEKIFERFYKVKEPSNKTLTDNGSGLGLPIAREIIEAHGGKIRATSVLGKGTTFFIYLPVAGEANKNTTGQI